MFIGFKQNWSQTSLVIKIDWWAEGSYFLGDFLYFQVSFQVRMKIKLPVTKISMKIHFLVPYCPSQPYKQAGFIPARADMVGITFPFQFRKAHKGINTDHAVVGTESCQDIPGYCQRNLCEPSRNVVYKSGQKGRTPRLKRC